MRIWRSLVLMAIISILSQVWIMPRAEALEEDNDEHRDCGFTALYNLFAVEGHTIHNKSLSSVLPATNASGYSMKELKEAARKLGMPLDGVQLKGSLKYIDRPLLVYLRQGQHGHYVVVRPVGQSGKLIQLLDSNVGPKVVDAAQLLASPEWTGLALMPVRYNWVMIRILGILGLSAGGFYIMNLRRRLLVKEKR